jgi:hypothetical protein
VGGGYRVPAPSNQALVQWPGSFGQRFTVFVDTEEEFDWRARFSRDNRAVTHIAAIPAVHRRFAERGVGLTYLVDHPVAASPEAVDVLRGLIEDGRSTVGTQLHPWVNPPFDEEINETNSFVGNLSVGLEAAKLEVLTGTIEAAFGRRPIAYRAGRYGIGPATFAALARLGYRVDTSMRSAYDYSSDEGPDFTAIGNRAFHAGPILELPLTTVFTGRLRGQGVGLYNALARIPRGRGVAARLGLLSRVALTPEDMPLRDAMEAVRVAAGEGLELLNFGFHSPSVVPGHTPYVRTAEDLAAFHRWWEVVLDLLDRLGIRPASLDEVIDAAGVAAAASVVGPAGLEPATKPL